MIRFVGGPLDGQVMPHYEPKEVPAKLWASPERGPWEYRYQVEHGGARTTFKAVAWAPLGELYVLDGDVFRHTSPALEVWENVGKTCDACGEIIPPGLEHRPHQIRELAFAGYLNVVCKSCAGFVGAPHVVQLLLRVLARYVKPAEGGAHQ